MQRGTPIEPSINTLNGVAAQLDRVLKSYLRFSVLDRRTTLQASYEDKQSNKEYMT